MAASRFALQQPQRLAGKRVRQRILEPRRGVGLDRMDDRVDAGRRGDMRRQAEGERRIEHRPVGNQRRRVDRQLDPAFAGDDRDRRRFGPGPGGRRHEGKRQARCPAQSRRPRFRRASSPQPSRYAASLATSIGLPPPNPTTEAAPAARPASTAASSVSFDGSASTASKTVTSRVAAERVAIGIGKAERDAVRHR